MFLFVIDKHSQTLRFLLGFRHNFSVFSAYDGTNRQNLPILFPKRYFFRLSSNIQSRFILCMFHLFNKLHILCLFRVIVEIQEKIDEETGKRIPLPG